MTDVPINPVTRRVQFTGNTGTGPYAFTFNILQASDIAVFKNTATLTLTNDYTVAINANGTGAVTLVAALIASDLLTITGGRELSRTTDFVTGGPLLAGTLNEQLDSNVIMSQQLDEKFDRSLKIAQSDFTANLTLPIKSVRANQLLGFDASGNAVAGTGSTLNLTVANLTASSLTIPIGGSTVIEGFSFDSGKISTTITNDPLELYSNGTGTVIASPSLTVDNLKLDGNTFSSINSNGDINIFPNGSGTVNMDADLMVYGNDVNGVASYVQISASATGGDDIRLQGSNPVVASYDTSNVSAQTPSMLGAFSLYGKDTSGNYIAYATLRGYAEDPFAGTNGKEGSLRIQINDDSSIREHKFTATGLDVYNNITLSGTVDGRNIATDGSKLDGITANATTYSFSDTNGTVTVTPAQGSAATLIIGTAAGNGGLAMRGNAGGADSVALGTSSNAIGVNAITIGKSATTSTGSNSPTNGIAIGEQAHSYGSGTTALGRQASSIGDNSIALGSYASVPTSYHSSVALGYQATVNAANQIMLGTSNKTVKIPGALTVDGNITASGTVDGRDIATDGTKLNTIETNADVTDATNVAAAGALMKSGGAMTGAITTNSTFDTRDVATDGTKLDTIETNADVTDATNVNAAGAVMVSDTSTSGMGFVIDEDNMVSDSATKIPTQQSVKAYVDLNVSSSVQYRGSYNAATNSPNLDSSPSGITIGDMYTTTVAGTFYSTGLEIGDVLIAEVANPSSVNDWTIVQQNLDAASIKTLYESNADTNAFDDAEQTKLAGIEAGADVNIGQYFMISANSQGVANGEIITTHPNASGVTSEVIDFTGAGGLTVARAGNNLTFTSANTTYGFADQNGTVTITPSTGSAATLVIGTAAGSGGLAFRGNAGGADSVALGTSSNAIGINAIAIGKSATTSYGSNSPTNGIAIGEQAHSYGANTVALGRQASAEGASGIALGPYANVPSSYFNSTALGFSSTVTASNQIMLGTSGTAVNVPGTLSTTGNATFAGTLGVTGTVTANAGVIVDNFTLDGTTLALSSGDLTLDVAGDINFDADGGEFKFLDGGAETLVIGKTGNSIYLYPTASNTDFAILGNNGGVGVTALTLNMSDGGAATFAGSVTSTGLIGNATNFDIMQNTSDGSDNKRTRIGGGGDVISSRGALVEVSGNEHGNGGMLALQAGHGGNNSQIRSYTAGQERTRLDASGTLLIGKQSSSFSTVGQEFRSGGVTILGRSGGEPLTLNRTSNDGGILNFNKDNTLVGTIGSTSGSMYIQGNPATGKSGLTFFGSYIEPRDNGSPADNAIDLGSTSNRFKDLYLSGSVTTGTQVKVSGSNASNVAFSVGDTGTGWYNAGSNAIALSSNGTPSIHVTSGGTVGIGTSNPIEQFAVGGAGRRIEIAGGGGVIRGFDRTASWAAIDFEASGYTFDVSTARRFDITSSGAAVTGTLGVSGAITASADLTVGNSYISNSYARFANLRVDNNAYMGSQNTPQAVQIQTGGTVAFGYPVTMASTLGVNGDLVINPDANTTITIGNGGTNAAIMKTAAGDEFYIGANNTYALRFLNDGTNNVVFDNSSDVLIGTASTVANEKLRVDGAQVVGSGGAGLYTTTINQSFAASASKYLRIQLNNNLFGALTITATGNYSSVNAIGVYQKVYSVGINSSNTSIYSAGNTTTVDLGGTSGKFSMGTPSKPNATTYYIPMANLNASYAIEMSIVVEMRGYILGIASVDIIAA